MGRYVAAEKIVVAVVKDLSSRSGLDIEAIIDDIQIYESLKEDLFDIVVDILFQYDQEEK